MENYFELFGIPETLQPNIAQVKKQFYTLCKQYHPDRLAMAEEGEREEGLKKAAIINEAYKVVCNQDRLMAYVLQLHAMLQENEQYKLPPDFLMEMMELNELMSDYEDDPQNEKLAKQLDIELNKYLEAWNEEVFVLINSFENAENKNQILEKIKDYYFRKKYLLRIKERYLTFASR